jgi:sugar lactone lactonase YvrE
MPKVQTLLTSLAFGESPRWHDGCLWFSDCGAQEVWAVDLFGKKEVIARTSSTPMGLGFLPDGRARRPRCGLYGSSTVSLGADCSLGYGTIF